jgi:prepilin-type N-terminal cleavage/methylation domain-containing protein
VGLDHRHRLVLEAVEPVLLMLDRLRNEDGMTLPEMLIAIIIALVVSFAAFTLIEVVMRRTAETQGRVEASQKGRAAMDTMTRQLRSQVCLATNVPPMAAAQDNTMSFYVDLNDPSTNAQPELHTLTYDPAARTIVERDFVGTGTAPSITYPTTPTRVRTLAENVVLQGTTPMFRYYAYNAPAAGVTPRPDTLLSTPLSATNLGLVARIELSFRTLVPRSTSNRGSIVLQDQVYVRAADPNDPAPTPTCA